MAQLTKAIVGGIFILTSIIHLLIFARSDLGYKWDYGAIVVGAVLIVWDRAGRFFAKK